jgi:hypothetical protein
VIYLADSPLPYLLAEGENADRQAREALLCTFNADLGYFERAVLGVIQSAGARATVVGDARASDPDPRAARNAGTRYVHGLALPRAGGSFHPKVAIIAGPERAVVAVGSGNLSPGGWHLNAEAWTIATAGAGRCPAIVTQVAAWLRTLDGACAITPAALAGIGRTATQLEQLASAATIVDTGHRLVHTGRSALIDQLPGDDVDHLLLYAPFHDEGAEGFRAVIEQLLPNRVTLAVQSGGRTVIQPDAVRRVVADLGVDFEVRADTGQQYRHGKLIEAVTPDGSRWTLTGSPNLSARALLHPAAGGGNIEAGVITRPSASMFAPGWERIDLSDVPAVRIQDTGASRAQAAATTLLSAVRAKDGLQLIFARPLTTPARILVSGGVDFDAWTEAGAAPAGAAEHVLRGVDLPGGTRVRCQWGTRADVLSGSSGSLIFVTDPLQAERRPGDTSPDGPGDSADPVTLIADPRLMQHWLSSLGEIASARASSALRRASAPAAAQGEGAAGKPGSGPRPDTAEEEWLACADDARASLGPAMASFVLGGAPGLRAVRSADDGGLRLPADKVVDETRPGLDTDDESIGGESTSDGSISDGGEPGAAADPGTAEGHLAQALVPRSLDLPEAERRRARRLLTAHVTDEPMLKSLSAAERLAMLALVLTGAESGVWDSPLGEDGWLRVASTILQSLGQAQIPEPLSTRAASWAALGTYLMHEHRPTTGRPAEATWYEEAASAVAHLLVDSDDRLVADFAEPFTNANGYPVDPDAVMHVIGMVVQGDPLGEAIDILGRNRPGWRVDKHNARLLHVDVDSRSTLLPAAEALAAIPGDGMAAVWATGSTAGWTIAIRDAGTLIRVDKDARGQVTWHHFRLGPLTSPVGIARDPEQASRARIPHQALNRHFDEAVQALIATGISLSADPPSQCPADASQ